MAPAMTAGGAVDRRPDRLTTIAEHFSIWPITISRLERGHQCNDTGATAYPSLAHRRLTLGNRSARARLDQAATANRLAHKSEIVATGRPITSNNGILHCLNIARCRSSYRSAVH